VGIGILGPSQRLRRPLLPSSPGSLVTQVKALTELQTVITEQAAVVLLVVHHPYHPASACLSAAEETGTRHTRFRGNSEASGWIYGGEERLHSVKGCFHSEIEEEY
jgi:hypothetical protein